MPIVIGQFHSRIPAIMARFLAAVILAAIPSASSLGCTHAATVAVDDFSGPYGAAPNPGIWGYTVGAGWDQGIQDYRTANAVLDGDGHLAITAMQNGTGYTSGRVGTANRLTLGYGRVSARIKMPNGQGLWPAFWLLGADHDAIGWPECGEIDIVEVVSDPTRYFVTIHGPRHDRSGPYEVQFSGYTTDLSSGFHEYWVDRMPDRITIGVDGTTLATFTPESLPPDAAWVYNRPMSAILDMAVGGSWAGPPDASTRFPATMLVDWFRWETASVPG